MTFYLSDSYTLLLILVSIFVGITSWLDNQRIPLLLTSPFNQKYHLKYPRFDSKIFTVLCGINILVITSIVVSFYVFKMSEKMSFILFFQILNLLLIWIVLKCSVIFFIGKLFDMNGKIDKYYYGYYTNLFLLSLIFLPIVIIISYSFNSKLLNNYSSYCCYLFVLSYFTLKFIQLKRLNLFKVRLIFYNILYLYILEFMPYLILFRLLDSLT